MAEAGCMRDVAVQNLEVSGNTTLTNNLTVNGTITAPNYPSSTQTRIGSSLVENFGGLNFTAPITVGVGAAKAALVVPTSRVVPARNYLDLFDHLSNLLSANGANPRITAAQAQNLIGDTNVNASGAVQTIAAGIITAAQPNGKDLVVDVIGNATIAVNRILGTITVAATAAQVGNSYLLVFDTASVVNDTITLTVTLATSVFAAAGSRVFVSGAGTRVLTENTTAAQPTAGDTNLVMQATGATTILPGSYLYFNKTLTTGQSVLVHGCIMTTGGTIAVSFA